MPSPKSGNPANLVSPAPPRDAVDADVADPGEAAKVEAGQQARGAGKLGSTPITPFKRANSAGGGADSSGAGQDGSDPSKPKTFIEIVLVDKTNKPVPGEAFQVTMPDGRTETGTTDGKGFARIDGIDPGNCQITFTDLDGRSWEAA